MLVNIQGYCPACGEATLHVDNKIGILHCLNLKCTDKQAAHKILQDCEREHILQLDDDGWTLKHPLRERLAGDLFDCSTTPRITHLLSITDVDNTATGKYRVTDVEGVLTMAAIS